MFKKVTYLLNIIKRFEEYLENICQNNTVIDQTFFKFLYQWQLLTIMFLQNCVNLYVNYITKSVQHNECHLPKLLSLYYANLVYCIYLYIWYKEHYVICNGSRVSTDYVLMWLSIKPQNVLKVEHSSDLLYQCFTWNYFLGLYLHSKAWKANRKLGVSVQLI